MDRDWQVLPVKLPMQLNRNSFGHILIKEEHVGDKVDRRHEGGTGGVPEDTGMERM